MKGGGGQGMEDGGVHVAISPPLSCPYTNVIGMGSRRGER